MSENVTLRAITDADLMTLFESYRDPEASAMAGVPIRELDEFLAHRAKTAADPSARNRAIVADGELAGDIVSWVQDDGTRKIGYWIDKRFWGRGFATAGLRAFLIEVTDRPLYADALKTNAGSIRVLEKCGFRRLRDDELGPDPDPEEYNLRLDD
ncbi:MAG TPA: GNAT family N-acetyltransferase [Kribbella sp.]|nr:GNAT family N-acetyltransferase [Kribbella sp.]